MSDSVALTSNRRLFGPSSHLPTEVSNRQRFHTPACPVPLLSSKGMSPCLIAAGIFCCRDHEKFTAHSGARWRNDFACRFEIVQGGGFSLRWSRQRFEGENYSQRFQITGKVQIKEQQFFCCIFYQSCQILSSFMLKTARWSGAQGNFALASVSSRGCTSQEVWG